MSAIQVSRSLSPSQRDDKLGSINAGSKRRKNMKKLMYSEVFLSAADVLSPYEKRKLHDFIQYLESVDVRELLDSGYVEQVPRLKNTLSLALTRNLILIFRIGRTTLYMEDLVRPSTIRFMRKHFENY